MEYGLTNWMSQIDEKRDLLSLNIMGTHDCVTQYVQLSKWAKCQNVNIYNQLCLGARALDVRVKPVGNRLFMLHGITKAFNTPNHLKRQMELKDVLNHTYRFLTENPTECVIYQIKNENGKEMEKTFDILFNEYIEKDKKFWYTENRIPALFEVRGKIVLIRRCKIDTENPNYTDLNSGINFGDWIEQTETLPTVLTLENKNLSGKTLNKFLVQDRFKYKPEPRWESVIKPFLDKRQQFDGNYIINYLSTAGGLKGPYKNAKYINPKFLQYSLNNNFYYGVTFVDFITEELARKYIDTNFK